MNTCKLQKFAKKIRRTTCDMVLHRGDGHIGGALSMSDALAVLFGNYMKEEDWFVLSKGHAGPAYYAVLMLTDRLSMEYVHTLNENGTLLPSHPDRMKTPGVQVTTGSLGQGISQAAGIAYALQARKKEGYVFCMLGDGECNEGEVFEALQFIANKRLHNCIVMVDCNKKQVDGFLREVSCNFDFPALFQSIGFQVSEVDGNSVEEVDKEVQACMRTKDQACAILLNTVKGAGVPYFEQQENPHHVTFSDADKQALRCFIEEAGKELNA